MNLPLRLPESRSGRYALLVLVPSLLAWLYLLVFAADGYVSRAQVMVEKESSPSTAAAGAELALGLLNVGGGKSRQDALLVQDFMRSRTMLEYLDAELGLREHYSAPKVDFVGRLAADADQKEFLEYYRKKLTITIDDDSLILNVEFVAFDPEYAQKVAQKLVERSEEFVNEVSRQAARQQLSFVQEQVDQANERLKQASREMIDLQRRNAVFSPEKETEAVGQILAELEAELAKQRTQLKALTGYLNETAPDVVAAKQRIAALESQVEQERRRMVGSKGGGLNDLMMAYQDADVGLRLATEVYKTALATLETTRLDTVRKVKYLVLVDKPSLPDAAELPRVLYWTLTIFVFLNLAYFVMSLIIATIEDHRE
ncbi:sugar transporter [Fontimonas sp. SYSU GA230001]|uniref:sugar transporter n=1 Tax=Fontimonas sp. SYSU GA230001 TaxID=3142450 RepID=UPI0032B3813E